MQTATNPKNLIQVWDPLVRTFHWSLVIFFIIAFVTEDEALTLHVYSGYAIAGLIAFRLVWGMIGTHHARFRNFMAGPREAWFYLSRLFKGSKDRFIGHNPAGAMMILALLVCLVMVVFSGMILIAADGRGPLAGRFFAAWPFKEMEEIHEFLANLSLFLVILHLSGVAVSSYFHRENLIKAMVTGCKRVESDSQVYAPGRRAVDAKSRSGAAMLSVFLICALLVPAFAVVQAAGAGDLDGLLSEYESQGAASFDRQAGKQFWEKDFSGKSCTTCHGKSIYENGRHERTGKTIKPMAPSVNAERLTDAGKMKKWLLRNCKTTLGRECTAQEKGNVLSWLRTQ